MIIVDKKSDGESWRSFCIYVGNCNYRTMKWLFDIYMILSLLDNYVDTIAKWWNGHSIFVLALI